VASIKKEIWKRGRLSLILITTPDYLPQIGGLTTLTVNLTKVLTDAGIHFEVFHWNSYQDIGKYDQERLKSFSLVINVHYYFGVKWPEYQGKMVNILHGSEITFKSPIWWKKVAKHFLKKQLLSRLERSYLNVFISEYTCNLLKNSGYHIDHSRDVIIHNGIDTTGADFIKKDVLESSLVFVCIARDVKHKNIKGSVAFCEMVKLATGREIELILPMDVSYTSSVIKITKLKGKDEDSKNEAYKRAHINLLLSLTDLTHGFVEGFGLTVLEASLFGTPSIVMNNGGLVESVHDDFTGWVIDDITEPKVKSLMEERVFPQFIKVSRQCYEHTLQSHHLHEWGRLFRSLAQGPLTLKAKDLRAREVL
jgi:glycosyltransferase involved in cell wall biosynthesis